MHRLQEEERALVLQRLRRDTAAPSTAPFQWRYVLDAFKDPRTLLFMLVYIGCAEGIYSQSLFSPTIIAALGKWTTPQSLLLSVRPRPTSTFFCTQDLSDRFLHAPLPRFLRMLWHSALRSRRQFYPTVSARGGSS